MKSARLLLVLVIIIGVIVFSQAACNWQGGSDPGLSTPQPDKYQAGNLTATYGAGQLHAQLTAIVSQHVSGSLANP